MALRDPRKLAAMAYDGMGTFELGIVSEVFGLSRPELNVPWYEFRVFSLDRAPLRGTGGIRVQAPHGMGVLRSAGTIIVPGWHVDEAPPEALLRRLRAAHAAGARLVSICSGVFVLAATGLLDGKRATTHWRYAERLAARYPRIQVEADRLYVDEGSILTSAGCAAGLWGGSCELGGAAPGDAAASGWRAGPIRGRAAAGPARGGPGAGAGMGAGESGTCAAGGRSGAAGRDVAADLCAPVRAAEWHDAAPVADASARAGGATPPGKDGGEYRPGRGGSGSGIGGHAAGSLRACLGNFAGGVPAALFHRNEAVDKN